MPASIPVTATIEVSLTLTLTGVLQPFRKAPSVRGGPPEEPDEEAMIEDEAIEGITCVPAGWKTKPLDILANVDTSIPAVQTLLSNLLAAVQVEAVEALFEAGAE